jgi:hypothetical protein
VVWNTSKSPLRKHLLGAMYFTMEKTITQRKVKTRSQPSTKINMELLRNMVEKTNMISDKITS